jgi:hypothetical protein
MLLPLTSGQKYSPISLTVGVLVMRFVRMPFSDFSYNAWSVAQTKTGNKEKKLLGFGSWSAALASDRTARLEAFGRRAIGYQKARRI